MVVADTLATSTKGGPAPRGFADVSKAMTHKPLTGVNATLPHRQ
jgi:hypothetical protein